MTCKEKVWYPTRALAEDALRGLIKTTSDRKAAGHLVVYPCRDCPNFHVGHLRRSFRKMPTLTPAPVPVQKPKNAAQLRRAEKKLEKATARQARHGLREAGWYVQDLDTAAAILQDRLDSVRAAKRIVDEIFAGIRKA